LLSRHGSPRQRRRGRNVRGRREWYVAAIIFPFQHQHILDSFIVPDREDELSARPSSLPHKSRIYPVPAPGLSRYARAINAISQHYGIDEEREDLPSESDEEDTNFEVLDDIGLWKTISDWLSGALNFESLMRKLDFQHSKCPKIGYWEDWVSELAFESNLNMREEEFKAILLPEHHQRLTTYKVVSDQLLHSPSPDLRSPLCPSTSSNVAEQPSSGPIKIWSVKIVPGEFYFRDIQFSI
jgi:hypothetical protein